MYLTFSWSLFLAPACCTNPCLKNTEYCEIKISSICNSLPASFFSFQEESSPFGDHRKIQMDLYHYHDSRKKIACAPRPIVLSVVRLGLRGHPQPLRKKWGFASFRDPLAQPLKIRLPNQCHTLFRMSFTELYHLLFFHPLSQQLLGPRVSCYHVVVIHSIDMHARKSWRSTSLELCSSHPSSFYPEIFGQWKFKNRFAFHSRVFIAQAWHHSTHDGKPRMLQLSKMLTHERY